MSCLLVHILLLSIFALPIYIVSHVTSTQALVSECPGRSVSQVRAEASQHELSLLLYYVSWSSDARQARLVFDGVAHYYNDYAHFGAMDCWHLQCNCSRTHRPVHAVGGGYPDKWPTLIVLYGRQLRIEYLGGWNFEDLTRFMNHLVQPVDRVQNSGELAALRRLSDAVVLALLDSADSKQYKRFVAAALLWLELDPERNIRFTVALGDSAKQMLKTNEIALPYLVIIDNRSRVHTHNASGNWDTLTILRWVRSTLRGMALTPMSPKTIAVQARTSPVLAMAIGSHHPTSHQLYMGDDWDSGKQSAEMTVCEEYWSNQPSDEGALVSLAEPTKSPQLDTQCHRQWQLNRATLSNYYHINSYLNSMWSQYVHKEKLSQPSKQLLSMHARNRCLAHTQHGSPALKIGIVKLVTKYGQLMWQNSAEQPTQNRSLSVVLFDATKYRDFLQHLGISQQQHNKRDNHAVQVFIIDVAQEALHVMPQHQAFSYKALKEFIKQFYAGQLPRLQRNAVATIPNSKSTHYIHNYNRQLLLQALHEPNATNVILMYRPDCALSAVMSQTLIQVAALLRSPEVRFVRFNSQSNDLPWELYMTPTPSLLVFPRSRPEETIAFPHDIKADVQNVFAFVLAQLEPELQLRLVLASCRRRKQHARSCIDFARQLVMQHVSQYLKYWEIFETERNAILTHLKEFNDIYMAIESSITL